MMMAKPILLMRLPNDCNRRLPTARDLAGLAAARPETGEYV
jgi:hypothetical protein